jgi:hypothetical protein
MHGEEAELEEIVGLGTQIGVLLHKTLDELASFGRHIDGVVDLDLVDLDSGMRTFTIFSITTLRFSPSKGTRPVSNSNVSTPMHQMSTDVS